MSTALAIELSKPTADQQAEELAALLRRHFDHQVVRQTGSHLRLATSMGGEHRITVPAGGPLRVGTLAAILSMSPSIRGLPERTWKDDCLAERRQVPTIAATSVHQAPRYAGFDCATHVTCRSF